LLRVEASMSEDLDLTPGPTAGEPPDGSRALGAGAADDAAPQREPSCFPPRLEIAPLTIRGLPLAADERRPAC
jgi:hypothetical protein